MAKEKLTLGEAVRMYRERADLSQEELAEKISVSRATISLIERNETKRPSPKVLEGFERTIGLSRQYAYELIGRFGNEYPSDAVIVQQAAALPTREARVRALARLPQGVRDAIAQLAQDLTHLAQTTILREAEGFYSPSQHVLTDEQRAAIRADVDALSDDDAAAMLEPRDDEER